MRFIYIGLFFLAHTVLFATPPKVLVSVAPYVALSKELAHDALTIDLLVPPGFSSHTYEPTPKQVLNAMDAKVWFSVGELFEKKVRTVLTSENPTLVIIDLREGLDLCEDGCHHHDDAHDPHIWMSPKMVIVQVEQMAKALIQVFPELTSTIVQNRQRTIEKLKALDQEIRDILVEKQGAIIFVSHPAYGYFCKEYGVKQIAIEFEGKDPTPRDLTALIQKAKELKVKTIFTQPQYSTKAAQIIAEEIGASCVMLNPYAEDYFTSMRHIAQAIATGSVQ